MKKQLLLLFVSSFLLSGCVSFNEASSNGDSSSSNSIIDESDIDRTELDDLSEIDSKISISSSGYLLDISMGMSLASHSSYAISFELSDNPTGVINVKTDNPNVMTIETSSSGTSWTIKTHKQGKSHLIIEDGDTIIHFRKLITIKRKLTQEEVAQSLIDTDHYKTPAEYETFFGKLTLTFLGDSSGTEAYISGTESGGVTLNNNSFSYQYDSTYNSISENHQAWYIYVISKWELTDFKLTYFAVWNTGDWIHLHTSNALLGFFEPVTEE